MVSSFYAECHAYIGRRELPAIDYSVARLFRHSLRICPSTIQGCPAGRAPCAGGGHFVTFNLV